uniref:Uncharacterized protein n=1 Tax=Anguilla anguilla TaxID=7936 RepID=A0A0E9VU77_ANGAN
MHTFNKKLQNMAKRAFTACKIDKLVTHLTNKCSKAPRLEG